MIKPAGLKTTSNWAHKRVLLAKREAVKASKEAYPVTRNEFNIARWGQTIGAVALLYPPLEAIVTKNVSSFVDLGVNIWATLLSKGFAKRATNIHVKALNDASKLAIKLQDKGFNHKERLAAAKKLIWRNGSIIQSPYVLATKKSVVNDIADGVKFFPEEAKNHK